MVLDRTIPSDVREIEHVVADVAAECRALGLPERAATFQVPIALTEALANAILAGNHESATKRVQLRVTASPGAVDFDVIDEGAGFDMRDNLREPESDDLEREDGRGLFLMRELMDDVAQFREPAGAHRNVVRLTLHR